MKDHLKLNTNLLSKSMVEAQEAHRKADSFKVNEDSRKTGEVADSLLSDLTGAEDRFDGRLKGAGVFDDAFSDGIDLNRAMDFTSFIRRQAAKPEGRSMMSAAHHSISSKQVAGLFATA